MFSWILAFVLALLVWCLAAFHLWFIKRRTTEIRLGLKALAGMHWREFSQLIHRAMHEQRGWVDVFEERDENREPQSDFLMQDGKGQRWLVSCKHGRAYRIGSAAMNELGAALRLAGARGGVLITEGKVERDGLAAAQKQSIEVLDGRHLWPLLRSYLPGELEASVTGVARREAQRHISIAALASVTLGLLVGMGYLTALVTQPDEPTAALPVVAAAPEPPAPALAPAAADATPVETTGAGDTAEIEDYLQENPDDATLARYQQAVSRSLSTRPGIISALWLTRLTLSVDRSADDDKVWPLICEEVTRYPALRTVRIQLNPRPGYDEPVRWRQCSTI